MKILSIFCGTDMRYYKTALEIFKSRYNFIEIVGIVTLNDYYPCEISSHLKNFDEIDKINFDIILLIGNASSSIVKKLKQIGIDENRIISDNVACIPNFSIEKYNTLRNSKLSIFSSNCFGGILYGSLKMEFRSPLINMTMSNRDFLKFLCNPRNYLNKKPHLEDVEVNKDLGICYPIFLLKDIHIHMNHYNNFEYAITTWFNRIQKINWNNLFVAMYTDDPQELEFFDNLPYAKKACFVSFSSSINSAYYIDTSAYKDSPLWNIVNKFGAGRHYFYDIWEMLLYGKKVPL